MLADVGERLLNRPVDGDPLRRGERLGVAADLEPGVDTRALREGVDLAVEALAERPRDDAARLQGARDLPQMPVELGDACEDVVEATGGSLAMCLGMNG